MGEHGAVDRESVEQSSGLTRRQLLTRGAVAAGVVWAAPVIRSTAAYATSSHGTERPCSNFFFVSVDPTGHCFRPGERKIGGDGVIDRGTARALARAGGQLPPGIAQWLEDNPRVQLHFPEVGPQLTQSSDAAWALLLPRVTGPNADARQCRMVMGWGRKDNDYAEAYVDPNPPLNIEVGLRLIFPKPVPAESQKPRTPPGQEQLHASDGPSRTTTTTSTSTTTTTTTTRPPAGGELSAGGGLAADGATNTTVPPSTTTTTRPAARSGADALGGDGTLGPSDPGLTTDGTPSTEVHGPAATLDEAYLIFCCPD
jgi:hypothetical protein